MTNCGARHGGQRPGAGLMRRDQAEDAVHLGQGVVWPGWQGRTWLCWVASDPAPAVAAAAAVRDVVLDVWASPRVGPAG